MTESRLGGYRPWFRVGIALWAGLALVFAFTDEAISDALINQDSAWAGFLELYGQIPGAIVGTAGGAILLRLPRESSGKRAVLETVGIGSLTILYALALSADAGGAHHEQGIDAAVMGVVFVVAVAAVLVIPRLFEVDNLERARPIARLAFALPGIAAILTVWAIKIPWGRWTPRDILEAGDPDLFSPWFIPQGVNGHHAFISGHTAFSFVVLPFAFLFTKTRRAFNIALIAGLAWGVLGGLSRIVIGAHSASDTLFAASFTILWFAFLSKRYGADGLIPPK